MYWLHIMEALRNMIIFLQVLWGLPMSHLLARMPHYNWPRYEKAGTFKFTFPARLLRFWGFFWSLPISMTLLIRYSERKFPVTTASTGQFSAGHKNEPWHCANVTYFASWKIISAKHKSSRQKKEQLSMLLCYLCPREAVGKKAQR